jgi:hypothetical protein
MNKNKNCKDRNILTRYFHIKMNNSKINESQIECVMCIVDHSKTHRTLKSEYSKGEM